MQVQRRSWEVASSHIFAPLSGGSGARTGIAVAVSQTTAPQISPDGHWWWDGQAWQPIASLPADHAPQPTSGAAGPPAAGASPADSWPAWLPRTPDAEAVLLGAEAQLPGGKPVDEKTLRKLQEKALKKEKQLKREQEKQHKRELARAAHPAGPRFHLPLPHPHLALPHPHLQLPNLSERSRILAGLAALGTVALLGSLVVAISHGHPARPKPVAAQTPAPLKTGSERARADRFLTYALTPAVTDAGQSIAPLGMNCNTAFSRTCRDALSAADQQLQMSITNLDRGAAPPCLAGPVKQVRADLQEIDASVQAALAAFPSNSHEAVAAGVARAIAAAQPLTADASAVNAAKSSCSH